MITVGVFKDKVAFTAFHVQQATLLAKKLYSLFYFQIKLGNFNKLWIGHSYETLSDLNYIQILP